MKRTSRVIALVVAGVAIAGAALAGYDYVFGFGGARVEAASPSTVVITNATTTTLRPTTTTTRPTTTTTTLPAVRQPAPQPMPPGSIGYGARGDLVLAYEQRLAALRFDPGPVDGYFDQSTRYAVEAVQKIYDLPRTGAIGEPERFVISAFRYPEPLEPASEANRTEVSLDRQFLIVYQDFQPRLVTTVSTGSGRHFCGGDDGCQYAVTTPGRFTFQWFYNGWKKGKLGTLYKPYYFNGGIAVHGYTSVPTYNASHGCVRIPMHVADYFHDLVGKGEPIYVVGTAADPTSRFSGPGPGPQGTVSPVGDPSVTTTTAPAPPTTAAPSTTAPSTTTSTAAATTTTTKAPSTTTTTHATTTTHTTTTSSVPPDA